MKAMVLFSGGLDSTTCLALALERFGAENVIPLSITYGQKHDREIKSAEAILRFYGLKGKMLDLGTVFADSDCSLLAHSAQEIPKQSYAEQQKEKDGAPVSTYVPFRNGLFLSCAAGMALSQGCSYIYYGIHRDDAARSAYPDCSEEFHRAMYDAIYAGTGKQIEIVAPFSGLSKADIVQIGQKIGVPYELTWSCYNGREKACGKCATCIDRIRAFEGSGQKDPIPYEE